MTNLHTEQLHIHLRRKIVSRLHTRLRSVTDRRTIFTFQYPEWDLDDLVLDPFFLVLYNCSVSPLRLRENPNFSRRKYRGSGHLGTFLIKYLFISDKLDFRYHYSLRRNDFTFSILKWNFDTTERVEEDGIR